MKRLALALAVVACQRTEPSPAGAGSAPGKVTTQVVGCAPAGERPRVAPRSGGGAATAEVLPAIPKGWFPYAVLGETPAEIAGPLAAKANLALVEKLADLDLCLTDKTGSVSIMLEVDKTGAIKPRVGGIGHHPTELCIAKVVAGLALPSPPQVTELECGLSAGAAGPLRVDVEGGYRIVDLGADTVTLDGKPLGAPELAAPVAVTDTVLVIAAPDVTAARLATTLAWVERAPAVLVAVRADGGPPVFVAMAPDRRPPVTDEHRLGLAIDDRDLVACTGDHRATASLLEAKQVDAMLDSALAACGERCAEVVEIGVAGAHTAKQLVGASSAVRRAGRDPVLAIGARCAR